jgi:hypothetical protein
MPLKVQRSYTRKPTPCIVFALFTLILGTASRGFAQTSGAERSPQTAQDILNVLAQQDDVSPTGAFATTVAYVVQFYPLWFTYNQTGVSDRLGTSNDIVAPDRLTPLSHFIVANNYDTLYAGVYLDLRTEPVIVTLPKTSIGYSILTLDPYGTIIETAPPPAPGTYALTGPTFSGALPAGITPIPMPINFPSMWFRAPKYAPNNQNQIEEAEVFRAALRAQTLSESISDPSGGATKILPERNFAKSFKLLADSLIARAPIKFLKQLQTAVAAPNTPPLSPSEQKLSSSFDALFGDGTAQQSEFSAGAQKAHALIVDNYLTHTGPTNWIHFTNIGDWGDAVLDRSSITEFLQASNGISTAAYYDTFVDATGAPLQGGNEGAYVLTFPSGQLPSARLFWSVTAYTPDAIELVPNPAHKYVVARYTPGLQYNPDGSLSIYMATSCLVGVPTANWLPVPPSEFSVVLRVYGPQGDVADNTYIPPGIQNR